jgi:hypothetical protein
MLFFLSEEQMNSVIAEFCNERCILIGGVYEPYTRQNQPVDKSPVRPARLFFIIIIAAVTVAAFRHHGAIKVIFKLKSLYLVLIFARHHANINPIHI